MRTPQGRGGASGDHQPPAVATPSSPARSGPRNFGEEGGLLSYGGYLRLPDLFALQVPQAGPPAHDELLFITVHQVYELWFGQLLHELAAVRDAMTGGQTWRARHLLRRVHAIERLLISQVDILETMTPQDFGEFRSVLAPASGFQSVQYRELEFLSGLKDPEDLLTHDELAGLWRARHVTMVERQIGTKSGTGGSTGAPYLRARVPVRYYPLLWELRDFL